MSIWIFKYLNIQYLKYFKLEYLTSPSGGLPTWDDNDIWSKSKVYWWPKVKIIIPIILSLWSPAWHKCVAEGGRRRKVSHLSETDVKVWPEYDHDCDDDLDHIDNDGHKKDGDMFPIWVKQMSRFGLSLIMIVNHENQCPRELMS